MALFSGHLTQLRHDVDHLSVHHFEYGYPVILEFHNVLGPVLIYFFATYGWINLRGPSRAFYYEELGYHGALEYVKHS